MNLTELPSAPSGVVLRLMVRNHPGVMSHVCGLFSRRSFNLEAIICVPVEDGGRSEMLLLVRDLDRLEQLVLQLRKLRGCHRGQPRAGAARGLGIRRGNFEVDERTYGSSRSDRAHQSRTRDVVVPIRHPQIQLDSLCGVRKKDSTNPPALIVRVEWRRKRWSGSAVPSGPNPRSNCARRHPEDKGCA